MLHWNSTKMDRCPRTNTASWQRGLLIAVCVFLGCDAKSTIPRAESAVELDLIQGASGQLSLTVTPIGNPKGFMISQTGNMDTLIQEDALNSLGSEVEAMQRTLSMVLSGRQRDWVVYIAHNLNDTKVTLRLLGTEDGVGVKGQVMDTPIALIPGAHGFQFRSLDRPVCLEHLSAPLRTVK